MSIKPASATGVTPPPAPDRYYKASTRLSDLLMDAFGYHPSRIAGLPDWNGTSSFEVSARAAAALTPESQRAMVQRLLAERFAFTFHIEPRELSYYAMTVRRRDGQFGPRLSRTPHDCAAIRDQRARRGEVGAAIPRTPGAEMPICSTFMYSISKPDSSTSIRYMASGMTLPALANFLSGPAGRPVLDRTGLSGEFDLDLEFARLSNAASTEVPDLTAAVEDQLGLHLQSERGPVDVLVIDSVSRPEPN